LASCEAAATSRSSSAAELACCRRLGLGASQACSKACSAPSTLLTAPWTWLLDGLTAPLLLLLLLPVGWLPALSLLLPPPLSMLPSCRFARCCVVGAAAAAAGCCRQRQAGGLRLAHAYPAGGKARAQVMMNSLKDQFTHAGLHDDMT
jgi:hypothetical protein